MIRLVKKPQRKDLFWMKLDNAGKIFPAQNTETWSHVIRETVVLNEDVDVRILTKALEDIMPRFPCFAVRMRSGLFWNYLQEIDKKSPKVLPDINNPCRRIAWQENDGFLFRVFYDKNRISVEFYHAITDGYGMTCFIMTLVAQYLRLKGVKIRPGGYVLDINDTPSEDELSDAFQRFSDSDDKPVKSQIGVYHFVGTNLPPHNVHITTGYLSVEQLKKFSRKYGVTITEFLAAVSLYAMYKQQEEEVKNNPKVKRKPLGIQIPMNGRFKLPTKTLRNFSLFTFASFNPQKAAYTFDDVVAIVAHDLRRAATMENFKAMVTENIAFERNPLIRVTPLFIKNAIVKTGYSLTAENDTSVLLTNLGKVDIPKEMMKHIDRVVFMPTPGRICGARSGVASLGDVLAFTFMNIYEEKDIEYRVFGELRRMGLDVKVESNYPFTQPDIPSEMPYSDRSMKIRNDRLRIFAFVAVATRILKTLTRSLLLFRHPFEKEWNTRFFHY